MKKFFQSKIFQIAGYMELFITVLLIVVIGGLSIQFMIGIFDPSIYTGDYETDIINNFLHQGLSLAVGIEFVKMLSKHSLSTVIEVLLFATARQMVVVHNNALDTLLGVMTIAALFAIRKFLFCRFDEEEKVILRAGLKIKLANIISHVHIPEEDGDTLGNVITRMLEAENETVVIGAVAYYKHVGLALRVAEMNKGEISQVEVIRSI